MYDQTPLIPQDVTDSDRTEGVEVAPFVYPYGSVEDFPMPGDLKAIKAAIRDLEKVGLPLRIAEATAWAACDPRDLSRRIKLLLQQRVQGATMGVLDIFLWSAMVTPYLANPRANGARCFPVSGGNQDLLPAPHADFGVPHAELLVNAESPQQVHETLQMNDSAVLSENDYTGSIAEEGINEPIWVVPMTVSHDDGTPAVTMLTSIDGSSRVSSALKNINASPGETVYPNAVAPATAAKNTKELIERCRRDPMRNLSILRSLTVRAQIIITVRQDDPTDRNATLVSATRSLLGSIHVGGATPWSPRGKLGLQADSVVEALLAAGRISEVAAAWMSGTISIEHAVAAGLPSDSGVRYASILHAITDPANEAIVRAAMRATKGPGENVHVLQIREVAAELGLRVLPSLTEKESTSMTGTLARALTQDNAIAIEADGTLAWAPTERSGKELLEAATALPETRDVIAARRELTVRGVYALAMRRIIYRADRSTKQGKFANSELEPGKIVDGLLKTKHGLRTLAQAIDDYAAHIPLRALNEDGSFMLKPNGEAVELTRPMLYAIVPVAAEVGSDSADADADDDDGMDPVAAYLNNLDRLLGAAGELDSLSERMESALDFDGTPVAQKHGVNPEPNEMIREAIRRADDRMVRFGFYAMQKANKREARLEAAREGYGRPEAD